MKIETLPWLERYISAQFAHLSKVLKKTIPINESVIREIKACYLHERQLSTLGKQLINTPASFLSTIKHFNLGIVSNYNVEFLQYPLMTSGLRYDHLLNIKLGSFNNIAQEALNKHSTLHSTPLDAVLILLDHHFLEINSENISKNQKIVQEGINFVHRIVEGFNSHCSIPCIISTIVTSPFITVQSKAVVDEFNTTLKTNFKNTPHYVFDVAAIANVIGLENWHQPAQYYLAKLGFSHSLVPLVVDKIARFVTHLKSSPKKCIVFDLDNTLWGGIIGDLGTAGVMMGKESPLGEAFVEFQKWLLHLKSKGFLLAVCSKNDEVHAKDPFISRKDMILRLDDLVAFKANWLPKSQNLRSIADHLSLDLSSFIFIDDNIAEREEVRLALPEVAVPALPDDPSFYPFVLLNSGLFDLQSDTAEDESRTRFYQENLKREEFKQSFTDLNSYYQSLEMKLTIFSVSPINSVRALQLINKTNQFNLTQKRFSEPEFLVWKKNKNHVGFCFNLVDKFGDNGMIGVILTVVDNKQLMIENFVLSCRVIGREVENAIINFLVAWAQEKDLTILIGKFKSGTRNQMVEMIYQKWGFQLLAAQSQENLWELHVENFVPLNHAINVFSEIDSSKNAIFEV